MTKLISYRPPKVPVPVGTDLAQLEVSIFHAVEQN